VYVADICCSGIYKLVYCIGGVEEYSIDGGEYWTVGLLDLWLNKTGSRVLVLL